ncbi:GDSL-type esterase/lipase family protein [Mucilaginibacter sp. PAMB04168]|uniref:GDSL-type esterase/lipase family protein n=1 Tax=Mucilaginibacter sp. PAMB04168 TaxID=3138567 RepID=UPI0031F6999E
MKHISTIILFFLVSFAASAQDLPIDSSYANSHYKQRLQFFRQMPDSKNEIVFLGNSITEAGEWQELIPGKNVINRGISGDVSFGVIARLDEVLSSKPKKIFLLIGINDLKRGIPAAIIIKNYQRIIGQVKLTSPKTQLILQSILPVNELMLGNEYKRITNARVSEVNNLLQQLAASEKLTFVDLHPIFKGKDGQMNRDYTTDGIHLKMPAYILWVNLLKSKGLL